MKMRILGIDIIKTIAILFVILVHGFINSGYYNLIQYGKITYLLYFIRVILLSCVPLFMIATGYLASGIKLSKSYYKKIIPILINYFIISIITLLSLKYILGNEKSISILFLEIFNFSTISYSWYIEMYIGLFMIIPFLNLIYHNLKNEQEKKFLVVIMVLITFLPSTINKLNFLGVNLEIIPNWWHNIYPLTYYFIGNYIKEFKPMINKKYLLITVVVVGIMSTIFKVTQMQGNTFNFIYHEDYNSIIIGFISVSIFLLLYNVNIKNKWCNKIFKKISSLTLSIYLFSYIIDLFYIEKFNILEPSFYSTLATIFIVAPIIFGISLLLAYILDNLLKIPKLIKVKYTK